MTIPHRQRVAAALTKGARWLAPRSRLRLGLQARRRRFAKAPPIYVLAALATLGVAGTSAAHYAVGLPGAAPAAGASDAAGRLGPGTADIARGAMSRPPSVPQVRLASSGDNPFVSFLKGIFGADQPRTEPRRWRQPERGAIRRLQPPPPPAVPPPAAPETFRTMCVRLCDGYYWPVSFATTRENFDRDQRICTKSCGTSATLYAYPNPGGEVDDMVSVRGQPYKNLGTAFLYRTTYDASCKCTPHPWEPEAAERHKTYAKPPKAKTRAASQAARRR